ncbi:MAG: CoA transferase [Elusimicrobia bacterium]|nr:CoA transferase [Elusimicrobiota bacterium]
MAGVKVLDLSRLLPGPFCTMFLADLGCEVINVAMPKMPDPLFTWFPPGPARDFIMATVYRGKKSAVIDFKKKEGRDIVLRLAQNSDVFVEGFRFGSMQKIGLGYEDMFKVNPAIIYCSISGYGHSGPYRKLASHDINYLALSGFLSLMKASWGDSPNLPPLPIGDIGGGSLIAAISILAALYERSKSGQGQHIDLAMLDGLFSWMFFSYAVNLTLKSNRNVLMPMIGNDPFYGIYQTSDGRHLAVGAVEAIFRDRLLTILGRVDLKPDMTSPSHWKFIREELRKIFLSKSLSQWQALFQGQDLCVTPILSAEEALRNEQLVARGRAKAGPMPRIGHPFCFSRSKVAVNAKGPAAFGKDTSDVLRSLGLSKREIEELRNRNAII